MSIESLYHPEQLSWEGYLVLAGNPAVPVEVPHPLRNHECLIYLYSTMQRALSAAALAGVPDAAIVKLTLQELVQTYAETATDMPRTLVAETPWGITCIGGSEPPPADGFLMVDNTTEEAFDDIQGRGFGERSDESRDQWDEGPESRRYALAHKGRLASGLETQYYRTIWNGALIPMEGLGGVVAPLEARRHGHTRELVRHTLSDMRDRGVPISTITTPFSYPFYRRLGWEYAFSRQTLTFSPTLLQELPQRPGTLRHYPYHPASGSIPWELALLYELSLKERYQGFARRTERQWFDRLKGTLTDAYVWDGAQGPEGYMILSMAKDRMDIRECLAVSDDALLGLLRAMGSLDSQTDQLVWDALPGTALDRWVSAPDQLKIAQTDQGMFRIVDLPAALEARTLRWPGAGTATFRVEDPLCEWNQGCWRVEFAEGRTVVKRAADDPQAGAITIQALSLIYAGTISAQDAVRYGGAALSLAQQELLTRAYRGQEPLLLESF